MKTILNVSAYQFVTVSDTLALRDSILSQARSHALRGTVLLADEGINLALAGTAPALR
ncbi:MAG: sulfurtransferase, partial [Burkholderiaceae bacterium]|nr:sulfurtransferase [Burkholderiaceae bacterium]